METKRVFAADIGASGGKCFTGTFSEDGFQLREVHRFNHGGVPFYTADRKGKLAERLHWDDILIYRNIVQGLETYSREIASSLDSIGIDTWGTDGVFVTADGDTLGKVYCYRDHRLDGMIDEVKRRIDARRLYQITGIHFWPFNLSNQLLWFVMKRKDLLRPGVGFVPMPSLFTFYLGGVIKIDSSWASVSQLMDARSGRWSGEVLGALGIPEGVLPEIVIPGSVIGRLLEPLADSLGLNRPSLVAVGSHDTASAFAAAPVARKDEALIISSGTWSLVGKLIPEPITTDEALESNISNEGGIGNIRFLKNCMGTWLVQELRRIWQARDGREMGWDEIVKLVHGAPPFGAYLDPDDPAFYNPKNMEEAIAAFCARTGQDTPKNRGAILRTVYEGLALKYRYVNEEISRVCAKATKVVHIVGGGSKNDLLNQFTADATGFDVVAGPDEATAVGNCMVQALGLGLIGDLDEALPIIRSGFHIKDFRPRDRKPWEKAYEMFVKIVETGEKKK
jgi:sugar (pentulose or hexulose) kinase